jgi:signal transduction histidine kinase
MPTTVLCIVEDDLGYLWIGSLNGIYRVARAELNAFADGESQDLVAQLYDRGDGLGTPEISEGRQPTALKSHDGRIWFATINGLSVVDPRSVPSNPLPPPVIIEDVLVNGLPLKPEKSGEFIIPPLSQRVDFRYTGICLKGGPRAHFKRRLEGLEGDWIDVGGQRTATYYSLAPGKYRFRVIAANEDGIWNLAGASIGARALPAWWQALWFQSAVGFLLAGLVVGGVQLRFRAVARAQAAHEAFSQQLIESQEKERRRISAELHDGLGQALLIVKHQASRAARAEGVPPEAVEQLTRLTKSTQTAIEEVRGIVSALRPVLMDSIGLSGALSAMLEQAAQSGEVKLKWTVENMAGAIKKEHEIELFRVVQEALNNVVKHSSAANVRIDLRRETARWTLEIEDDGCGFDAGERSPIGKPGGFGLNGMRERIRIIGGILTIDSKPGKGTLLRAEAPNRTISS